MALPVNEFPSCVFQDGGGVGWLWEWLRILFCRVVGEFWSFYRALFPYTPEMDTEMSVVMFFVVTPVPFIHIPCV